MRQEDIKSKRAVQLCRQPTAYVTTFFKWTVIGIVTGLIGGIIGTAFHFAVYYVTQLRTDHEWIIWLLPVGGAAIVALYKLTKVNSGVNNVLMAVHTAEKLQWLMGPLIFISTVITQLVGGSAGKEGAAIQIGGTIGYQLSRLFRVDTKDSHVFVMCGTSAVFAAVFGTPVTAAVFALEVISVGVMYYAAFIPCVFAALTGCALAVHLGVQFTEFPVITAPPLTIEIAIEVVLVAAVCGIISILFCVGLRRGREYAKKAIQNPYFRAIAGGLLLAVISFMLGTNDYNGAGMNIAADAVGGTAAPYAFALKLVLTVLTMSAGFKGGEIVPSMFVGATFGCTFGKHIGLNGGFGGAVGLVALFCGMVNCPIASVFLGIELFGSSGLIYYAMAGGVSFILSGNYGLYSGQKLIYSKLKAEFVNINIR